MSKLRATIKVQLPVAAIGKLYARLDDETTPHELRVKKGTRAGMREIVISCQITAIDYFNMLIKSLIISI